ncbi:hypothetical protein FQN60_012726, partial [Etheostoma spectabile]
SPETSTAVVFPGAHHAFSVAKVSALWGFGELQVPEISASVNPGHGPRLVNMAAPSGNTCGAMERSIRERVPPLLTDLYQFTMAYAYWRTGRHHEPAVFELFFRDNPFGGGFSLFAGLHDCLLFLRSFRFTDEDVEFLRSVLPPDTDPAFFQFLRDLDCSCVTLRSVPEGTVLLETSLLCLVNYASLVCSNAARFRLAAGPRRKLLEMGLRRAQGPDGGLTASRYTYIGGFDLSSNVQAGFLFGIPVAGTMAHSYITSFTSLEEVWPQTLVAVNGEKDPVDVISLTKGWLSRVCELLGAEPGKISEGDSGLLNFCAVALALCELGYRPVGVRLDSGDLCRHFSIPAFDSLIIVGTNNITEQSMAELNKKENAIDVVGVGTHLVTCTQQPSLGCVYKLVEVRGKPKMKISHPFLDLVCLAAESPPEAGGSLNCFPLSCDDSCISVIPAQVACLRQDVFTKGQVTHPLCSAAETKAKVQSSLQTLHPRHKRLQEPDSYTVALSEKLHNLVTEIRKGSSNNRNFLLAN